MPFRLRFRPVGAVLVEDRPLSLVGLGAHRRGLHEHLPVGDRLVGMVTPPLRHLVGHIRDPGTDDEGQPGVFEVFAVGLRHHPGVGDHRHPGQAVCGLEGFDHRHQRLGLGGVAVEGVDLQREPAHIGQQPDGDLRLQPAFLGEPGLAEPVTLVGLEVQGGDVVEHQGGRAEPDLVGTRRGQPLPPLGLGIDGQPPFDRRIRRRRNPELVQHPDRVELADRLDHPGQHQLLKQLVGAGPVQPERPVGGAQRLPQVPGLTGHDRRLVVTELPVVEVQDVLVEVQPLLGDGFQHLDLARRVSRPDVLDLSRPPPVRVHDLDRDRTTSGLHRPHIGHHDRLENPD